MFIDPQRLAFVMQRMQRAPQSAPQAANLPAQAFGGRLPAQAAPMAAQPAPGGAPRPMMPPQNMAAGRMLPR